jgi:hypothetical protein
MRPVQGGRVDRAIVDKAFDALLFIRYAHPAKPLG